VSPPFPLTSTDYPVKQFDGTKSIVISTVSWIGGKQPFLGWAYIGGAILCVLLAVAGLARHLVKPRKLGDMSCECLFRLALTASAVLEPGSIGSDSLFTFSSFQYQIDTLHAGPSPSPLIPCHQPGGMTNISPGFRTASMLLSHTLSKKAG
jgi:hypothetical protein